MACYGPFTSTSETVQIQIVDLQITKQSCPYALVGKDICYVVTIINNSNIDMQGLLFVDELAPGISYVSDTFTVDGESQTPMIADNIIQHPIDIGAGGLVEITFCVRT